MTALTDDLVPEEEIAAELGKSVRTLKRWRTMPNGIPFIQIGRNIFYRRESVRTWIAGLERWPNQRRKGKAA